MQHEEFWTGTNIRKSCNNAFTHGYGDRPHGYVPGKPPANTKTPTHRMRGGFAANTGTIHGMGHRRPGALTLNRAARA